MSFVTSEKLLLEAQSRGIAIGAFNTENMEMTQAIIEAATETRTPVILQTTPSTVKYGDLGLYAAMVRSLAEKADVPIALHLDHGESFELAMKALHVGYSSIMIDCSHLSLENNITLTKSVVDVALPCGIPVEAELGMVGGKEDDLDGGSGGYTDPSAAAGFVARTGVTSLAVAIGTAHGFYNGVPVLDVQRLRDIRKAVSVPLVLHGASGLSDDQLRECIGAGICKINFATELRAAYSEAVKKYLAKHPEAFDPKSFGRVGRQAVFEQVKSRIAVCNGGKA